MIELIILGLLFNNDLHGYQLKQIADKLTCGFYKISYSNLYPKLKKLEHSAYIKSKAIITVGGQEKVIYNITEAGINLFFNLMNNFKDTSFEDSWAIFKVKILFFHLITEDKQKLILQNMLNLLNNKKLSIKKIIKNTEFTLNQHALITKTLLDLEQNILWVQTL